MVNQKMRIELKISTVNGNNNIVTPEVFSRFAEELEFKTEDKTGKIIMCNRGKAMAKLVFHLINNDFIDYRDLGWLLVKYDILEKTKESEKAIIKEFEPRETERD